MKRRTGIALTCAVVSAVVLGGGPALADTDPGAISYPDTTAVGVHNSYDQAKYPYFADALDSGAGMLELDTWTNVFGASWRVSHENPLGNDNNCENAATPAELRTKARNTDLGGCLTDIRTWSDAHPGHAPVILKVELKDGFAANAGRGPAELDALLSDKLGDSLFRPADLVGSHATLDDAARANGWPQRSALAGKFVVELIPGTVEENNPLDTLWTDREYAEHLRDLAAAGRLGEAAAFPAVHNVQTGDPRLRYPDTTIRPWFVVFDGDASAFLDGTVDTGWYGDGHYLVVMTDAQNVSPAIDATHPTEQQARDRVALLAQHQATIVSSDWYPLPSVVSEVVPRG